jgi:predicted DCC family thiol-disulfide oxidoreductase YuxK
MNLLRVIIFFLAQLTLKIAYPQSMKPILIYDGNCGFCLYWINIWKNKTKDRVEYAPYQSVANQFPQISLDQFERSVQLVKPDGEITEGAKAVLQVLAYNPDLVWLLRTYQNFSLFAKVAEVTYYFVAKHRSTLSSVLSWIGKGN